MNGKDLAQVIHVVDKDLRAQDNERLPATFVYAGIDVEREGLLTGTRGQQIAGRFSMVRTGPFPRGPEWTALIAALETSLRLHHHTPGTLATLDTYLHQRTERITRTCLEQIEIDIAAESARTAGPKTR